MNSYSELPGYTKEDIKKVLLFCLVNILCSQVSVSYDTYLLLLVTWLSTQDWLLSLCVAKAANKLAQLVEAKLPPVIYFRQLNIDATYYH